MGFILDILKNRKMLWQLSRNDFRSRFASSYLGIVWAYVQPLATLLVLWYVFEFGLKNSSISNVPFIVWYSPAFLIWTFFADTLLSVTSCIKEYSYLVKKINFRVGIIPIVKVISSSFVHLAFIIFIFLLNFVYGNSVSIYNIQVFYYFFCTVFLLLGLGWLLSAIMPFSSDINSIVNVVIQIGFWATPIVWNVDSMPPNVQSVLKWNPLYYICNGYRDAFINHIWFWERGIINIYFWMIAIVLLLLGVITFKRLRPQFADVL